MVLHHQVLPARWSMLWFLYGSGYHFATLYPDSFACSTFCRYQAVVGQMLPCINIGADVWGELSIMTGVYQRWCSSTLHIGWDLCDRLCLVLVCRGRYCLGGAGSSLHSGIKFGRSRTGEGSSGGKKRGGV
jgi:hypothetical protein